MEETLSANTRAGLRRRTAIAEAAQRAAECERNKDREEAKTWRRVEEALKTMRGPATS